MLMNQSSVSSGYWRKFKTEADKWSDPHVILNFRVNKRETNWGGANFEF